MARQIRSEALTAEFRRCLVLGRSDHTEAARAALADAHVLSQPWAWMHLRVHLRMLRFALVHRDHVEARGQLLRLLVAAPGSLTRRYPAGNSGWSDVAMTRQMQVRSDLATLLAAQSIHEPRTGHP